MRNLAPQTSYYLPLKYRDQMPPMQELLRLRETGELTEAQALRFRAEKPDEELFDTDNDPRELKNLVDDPEFAEELDRLRAEYER